MWNKWKKYTLVSRKFLHPETHKKVSIYLSSYRLTAVRIAQHTKHLNAIDCRHRMYALGFLLLVKLEIEHAMWNGNFARMRFDGGDLFLLRLGKSSSV